MFRDREYANYIQVERSNFRKTFGKGWVRVVGGERGVDIFNKNKWRLKSVYSAAINFSFTTRMCENLKKKLTSDPRTTFKSCSQLQVTDKNNT